METKIETYDQLENYLLNINPGEAGDTTTTTPIRENFIKLKAYDSIHDFTHSGDRQISEELDYIFKTNFGPSVGYKEFLDGTLRSRSSEGSDIYDTTYCTNKNLKNLRYETRVNITYDQCELENQIESVDYTWEKIINHYEDIDPYDISSLPDTIVIQNSSSDKTFKKLIIDETTTINDRLNNRRKAGTFILQYLFDYSSDDIENLYNPAASADNKEVFYFTVDSKADKTVKCLSEFSNIHPLITPQNISDSANTSKRPFVKNNKTIMLTTSTSDLDISTFHNTIYFSPKNIFQYSTSSSGEPIMVGINYEYTSLLWSNAYFKLYLVDNAASYSQENPSGFSIKVEINSGTTPPEHLMLDYASINVGYTGPPESAPLPTGPSAPYLAKFVSRLYEIIKNVALDDSAITVDLIDAHVLNFDLTAGQTNIFNLKNFIRDLFTKLQTIAHTSSTPTSSTPLLHLLHSSSDKNKKIIQIIISLLIDIKRTGDYEQANAAKIISKYKYQNVIFCTGDLLCFTYASKILNIPCILDGQGGNKGMLILYRKKNINYINKTRNILKDFENISAIIDINLEIINAVNIVTVIQNLKTNFNSISTGIRQMLFNPICNIINYYTCTSESVEGVLVNSAFDKLIFNLSNIRFNEIYKNLETDISNINNQLDNIDIGPFSFRKFLINTHFINDDTIYIEDKAKKTYNDNILKFNKMKELTLLFKNFKKKIDLYNNLSNLSSSDEDAVAFKTSLEHLFKSSIINKTVINSNIVNFLNQIDYKYDVIRDFALLVNYFLTVQVNKIPKNLSVAESTRNKIIGAVNSFFTNKRNFEDDGITKNISFDIIKVFIDNQNYLNNIFNNVELLKNNLLPHYDTLSSLPVKTPTINFFNEQIIQLSSICPPDSLNVCATASAPASAPDTEMPAGGGKNKRMREESGENKGSLEESKEVKRRKVKVKSFTPSVAAPSVGSSVGAFGYPPPSVAADATATSRDGQPHPDTNTIIIDIFNIFIKYIHKIHIFINELYTDYYTTIDKQDMLFQKTSIFYEIYEIFNTYFNKTNKITKIEPLRKGKSNKIYYITRFGYPEGKNFQLILLNIYNFINSNRHLKSEYEKILPLIRNIINISSKYPRKARFDEIFANGGFDNVNTFNNLLMEKINILSNKLAKLTTITQEKFYNYLLENNGMIKDFFYSIIDDFSFEIYYYKSKYNFSDDVLIRNEKLQNLFFNLSPNRYSYPDSENPEEFVWLDDSIKMFHILKNLASYKNIIEMNYKPFNKHLMPDKNLFLKSLQLKVAYQFTSGSFPNYFEMDERDIKNYKLINYKINLFKELIDDFVLKTKKILGTETKKILMGIDSIDNMQDDTRYSEYWINPCYITLPQDILFKTGTYMGRPLDSIDNDINNYYVLIHKPRNGELNVEATYTYSEYSKKGVTEKRATDIWDLLQVEILRGGKKTKKNKRKKYKSIRKKKRYKNTKKRRKKSIKNKKSKRKSIKYKK